MNFSSDCAFFIKYNDIYDILAHVLRVLLLVFSCVWVLISIKLKDLRSPQMACMCNLCILCIFISTSGYITDLFKICNLDTNAFCLALTTLETFKDYYTGYSLCAIVVHRLVCVTFSQYIKNLKWKNSLVFLIIFWSLSVLFALIQVFFFNSNIYMDMNEKVCVIDTSNEILSFIFFIIFSVVIPNLIILSLSAIALNKITIKRRKSAKMDNKMGSQRVGLMIILLIMMYELYCVSNTILFYRKNQTLYLKNDDLAHLLIISKWFFHISSLALLYSHPNLINQYKKILEKTNLKRNSVGIIK